MYSYCDRFAVEENTNTNITLSKMNQSRVGSNNIKRFIKEAKQFILSDARFSASLTECLECISALDFRTVSCNKIDINLFFSSLWELMNHANAPHWNCVSILITAVKDPVSQKMLINTFKFMPILSNLLMKSSTTSENSLKLLNLMEELSVGIEITWQEPYLSNLVKLLYNWILKTDEIHMQNDFCTSSLSLLTNLCYKNLCIINLVIEIVDTRHLIKYLITKKSNESDSIQICRLFLSFRNVQGRPTMNDVHSYLGVSLQTLIHGIGEVQKHELYYVNVLLKDLCSDSFTKPHVMNYDHFEVKLQAALKLIPKLLIDLNDDSKQCLHTVLSILHTLIQLDLYSLRDCHKMMIELCLKTYDILELMESSYTVLADIISQYEEDGMLPQDVASSISLGLQGFLEPINLDVKTAGVSWLSFISALNNCHATRESILHNVAAEKFEQVVKEIIQSDCNDEIKREAIIIACHISLSSLKRNESWEVCFHHILSIPFTQKVFTSFMSNIVQSRKKQFFQIIQHPDFPTNRIDEVFFSNNTLLHNNTKESLNFNDSQNSPEHKNNSSLKNSSYMHTEKLDTIVKTVNEALAKNELQNIPTSHLIELYRYKMQAMEHRLNATNASLQSSNQAVIQLNHSMSILEATSKCQEETLIETQIDNEKLKRDVASLSEQMGEAEKVIKKFQIKLASEKMDREQQAANAQREFSERLKEYEANMLKQQEIFQVQLDSMKESKLKLEEQLGEQVNKNNELADILKKFEEKVKQREKKLEEANLNQANLHNQLLDSQESKKKLEKTLIEREKRLTQVTTQLEEMQRVQDMIASLMGNKGSTNVSTNSSNQ